MAELRTYRCDDCELEAEVSGGPDMLMSGHTETLYCNNCNLLDDYITSPYDQEAVSNACRSCSESDLVAWSEGNPCPKCGGGLKLDPHSDIVMAD